MSDVIGSRSLLAIIPARAGSKGVPGKNRRLIGGRPMVAYTVDAVRDSGVATRVVVSTDDPFIAAWCNAEGIEVHHRRADLSGDAATIADTATEVVTDLDWDGDVGVFQVTSPLRTASSIKAAWAQFVAAGSSSLMSVSREEHLFWLDGEPPQPLFSERVNRQYGTHRVLRETGAIQFVTSAHLLDEGTMVSARHDLFVLPAEEVLDIDTFADLEVARRQIERGRIVFRLTADEVIGSGHLFHCLQIAEELREHEAHFLLRKCGTFVEQVLAERGYAYTIETDLGADLRRIASEPTLVINDVLDTSAADVLVQKSLGHTVVTIEDLGEGARYADLVINALYPGEDGDHVLTGPDWAPLRAEFTSIPPAQVRETPQRLLLTYGGTDPSGLASRVAHAVCDLGVEVHVIEGAGAIPGNYPEGVVVKRVVANMAEEMRAADVLLTSAGRTVYEAAAAGVPVIAMAQNAREATHAHLGYRSGVIFLGLGHLVDDEHIRNVTSRVLGNHVLRHELASRLRGTIDGRASERIAHRLRGMMRGL